jgi:sugar lactone lactonase YvrE
MKALAWPGGVVMRSLLSIFGVLLLLTAAYLLLWPTAIDPQPWAPPPAPSFTGPYAPNTALDVVHRLEPPIARGPEAVTFDVAGRIYSGLEDGAIVRWEPDGTKPQVYARTGGRPLGLKFDHNGNLVVADAKRGLLSVAPDGAVSVLATGHGGVPFRFCDDLDIGADGTIYFSDATHKFTDFNVDILEHGGNGRLLAYDPATGRTRLLLDGLYFANGVALSPDQAFVLVDETSAFRVRRYWLSGPRAGQNDIFVDNLPGFPDNITARPNGGFWIALPVTRSAQYDWLLPRPWARKMISRLPLKAPLPLFAFVIGVNPEGKVDRSLQATAPPRGRPPYAFITSAIERDGFIYLGSVQADTVGRVELKEQ